MKKILVLFASILCLVSSTTARAQTGCIKYYGPGFDAVYYPTPLGGTGTFGPNYGGTPVSLPFGCWPTEPASTLTRECTIGTVYGGLLLQNHIQCPIDTYLPFFVLLASCLGAGFVRNRMLLGLIG